MKKNVIFRARISRTHKIGCVIIFIMAVLWSAIVTSCGNTPKGRIEQKFEEYVKKNFANPSDMIEIAGIELDDSIDMKEYCELFLSEHPDSIVSKIRQQITIMGYFAKRVPTWFRRKNSDIAMSLLAEYSELPLVTLESKWKVLKDEYEKVDSLNLIQKMYIIKARVKQGDNIMMQKFYAVDYMIVDSLRISDKEIPHTDSPQIILNLTDALDSYMTAANKATSFYKDLVEFNDKQIQVAATLE